MFWINIWLDELIYCDVIYLIIIYRVIYIY